MPKWIVRNRRQRGGFLTRHDFEYAGQDTINTGLNTLKRMVPGLIENAENKIGKVTEKRIAQVISQGGKELERVSPIILKKVIGQL